mmetsp:Transcript_20096/g.31519  ORF Transcript_20096/g.31519 Transcript_20096/m.31519 type:complete len:133 (-) Transcript_20096:106-504(-)
MIPFNANDIHCCCQVVAAWSGASTAAAVVGTAPFSMGSMFFASEIDRELAAANGEHDIGTRSNLLQRSDVDKEASLFSSQFLEEQAAMLSSAFDALEGAIASGTASLARKAAQANLVKIPENDTPTIQDTSN